PRRVGARADLNCFHRRAGRSCSGRALESRPTNFQCCPRESSAAPPPLENHHVKSDQPYCWLVRTASPSCKFCGPPVTRASPEFTPPITSTSEPTSLPTFTPRHSTFPSFKRNT